LLNEWVTKGELKDKEGEFFIKANDKYRGEAHESNAKQQWSDSFVFRAINISSLTGEMGDSNVQISVPMFLKPYMKEILSMGKSLKIIRFVDRLQIKKEEVNPVS